MKIDVQSMINSMNIF